MKNNTVGARIQIVLCIILALESTAFGIYNIFIHANISVIIFHFIAAFLLAVTTFLIVTSNGSNELQRDNSDEPEDTYKGFNLEDRVYPINATIVIKYNTNDHSMDEVGSVFNDVCTAFPNNVVVAIPDDMSIAHLNLEELEDTRNAIDSAIEYARNAKQKRGNKKEVVVE